ncbi:MAG TPA: glycosyl hydrolase family 28-related protein, partial [Chitinophaga sp.]|nr:glycosyl hydrolase family 28-related protein [Chitinophaga sp.]
MTLGTVTDLQATPGTTPNELCRLLGYYIPGDGGGGDFYWDAASTETPNGGTIFSTGTTGRWKRLIEGPLNVRWFGAKGDDIADDTAAFTAAIKCNGDIRKEIDVPAGTYKINSTVYLPRWTTLKGNGAVLKGGNIFETGYFDAAGTVISNASQLPDTDPKRCIDLKISGFTFEGVNNAFTLNNFEEGSFVTDCMFLSCTSCIR